MPTLRGVTGMTEAEWLEGDNARDLLGRLPVPPGSPRKLRLFAVACCRLSRQLLRDPGHRGGARRSPS